MIETEVIERTLTTAMQGGATWAEVFVEDRRASRVEFDDGRVTAATSTAEAGASVRVRAGDTAVYATTEDLSEAGLRRAAQAAAEAARSAGIGRDGDVIQLRSADFAPPKHVERAPDDVSPDERVELLRAIDDAARGEGGAIAQVSSACFDSTRRILVANTDGLLASTDTTRVGLAIEVVAKGDTGLQVGDYRIMRTEGFEALDRDTVTTKAVAAARQAVTKLGAIPAPAATLPVVIASGQGAFLFHEACGHSLELDLVRKGASPFAGRLGEQVASPLVTLVDDPGMPGENGAFAIDDEGTPGERTVLIRNGVLESYLRDRTEAGQEGQTSTGNGRRQTYAHRPQVRMTNTYLENGDEDPEAIIRDTAYGVYVVRLGSGQVNAIGDFVFGMTEAYLIENGELTRPLREANLIGNGPAALRAIDAVGNDFATGPGMCGKGDQTVPVGVGQPTLRVAALTIGGTGR